MYLSIIILPLLGSIVSGFFGRKVGVRGAQLITSSCVIITTILAMLCFFEVGFNNIPVTINLFRWIDSEWFNIIWGFYFDSLTVSMLIPVLIISSLVHIYSISYMSNDPHNQRFFSYLSLFTFMMIILVTANNYLLMFVGWEGVGVCSYLLVSFWFTRIAANQSSISAFLTNRVGDCFFTIGMFAILWSIGNVDYATVFLLAPYINNDVVFIIGICLLIGAMAKSSQIGLHVWLPMAMEGPTPVSALIHAATMVTAGVYLLMRSSPLIEYSSTLLLICLWLGAITTIFSSIIGLFQQDIKKIVAYSTMSHMALGHQTIFEEVRYIYYRNNSQVTKAHGYLNNNHISNSNKPKPISFNFKINILEQREPITIIIRWWVGTSETIRLVLIYFSLFFFILIKIFFIIFILYHLVPVEFNIWVLLCAVYVGLLWTFINKVKVIEESHSTPYNLVSTAKRELRIGIFTEYEKLKTRGNYSIFTLTYGLGQRRYYSYSKVNKKDPFFEWLAGVIDGNGTFNLSKKGRARFKLVMNIRNKKVVYCIKHKLGGSIRIAAKDNAIKYKLKHWKGLKKLLQNVNGLIRNPPRMLQMEKLCKKYEINFIYPKPLTYKNGWFSGFIDSEGLVTIDEDKNLIIIQISNKNKYLLDPLLKLYGGQIFIDNSKIETEFRYAIFNKKEVLGLIDNYFNKYPLKTLKLFRINLIKEFYWKILKDGADKDKIKYQQWAKFIKKWEKYQD